MLQAHTHQFLGTFGGPGNGDYRGELLRAISVITSYATKRALPTASVLLRLDGHDARCRSADRCPHRWSWGDCFARRDYALLDLEVVKQALSHEPDQVSVHEDKWDDARALRVPSRSLDASRTRGAPGGSRSCRHFLSSPSVGVERDGMVYELFVSTLPSPAFTASDVLDLYLHRGSFETVLADEDRELASDRWYSHTPCGQEFGQILALISSGTCAWNWGRCSSRPSYAPPNLPQHLRFRLLLPVSLPVLRSKHRPNMVLPNGHVLRLREASPGPLLRSNQMGRCAVPPIIRCIRKSAGWSATAPSGCSTLRASAIVEAALCGRSVKKVLKAASLGG